MSKNTDSSAYRKIDIDAYDADRFEDEAASGDFAAEVKQRAADVRSALNSGKGSDALTIALTDPPILSTSQTEKDENLETVLTAISSFKLAEVDAVVRSLPPALVDTLVQYLYRAMAEPKDRNCGALLAWHAAAVAAGGSGSIMRALAVRKTV